jgi:hypothetical protein
VDSADHASHASPVPTIAHATAERARYRSFHTPIRSSTSGARHRTARRVSSMRIPACPRWSYTWDTFIARAISHTPAERVVSSRRSASGIGLSGPDRRVGFGSVRGGSHAASFSV